MMANSHRLQLPDDKSFFIAFHMLCGFAVELYLEAYLESGVDRRVFMQVGARHNLSHLRELCSKNGLENDAANFLTNLFSEKHKNFEYCYMRSESTYHVVDW